MEDIISTEEVRERKVVRKLTSQASGCHHVPIEESEKLSIVIHERGRSRLSDNILQKLKSLEEVTVGQSLKPPRIQKVPFVLRDNKDLEKYFEPRMVSIGPIHHGKFKLTEKIKHKLASEFIKKHCLDKEELYIKIETEIENLRKCYSEEETKHYNDEDLAWMFLVDGCAVLHYIDCIAQEDRGVKLKELNIKNDQIAFAQQDLLLLENQLPYQVLELLMSSVAKRETLRTSIDKFIEDNIMRPQKQREQQQQQPPQKQQPQQQQQPQQKQQPQQQQQQQEEPTHLLHLLRKRLLQNPSEGPNFMERLHQKCKHCFPTQKGETTHNWHTFRNVNELKAAGIRLRPSKTSFLTDISFHRMFLIATLKLPPLIVDDSTAPKFLNLMAYEMCPDFVNDFGVTSYVCFLDSLIDQAEDVKELRNKHILHNALGSDEEVATLFNKITTDLVPNPETYDNVKECIQNHWDRRWTKWIAQGYNDHFSSPWTFLAFVGALIALALSFIQAWYAMPHDDNPCDKVCCNITRIITNAST